MPLNRSQIRSAHGKRLAYCDTLVGTYLDVFGTVDINLPERTLEEEEVTNDDSADFTKDFEPGLYDPGEAGFTYKYTDDMWALLEAIFLLASVPLTREDATKFWKVTFPSGATAIFSAYIKSHNLPLEGATTPTVEGSLRVKSKITWAAPPV